jgi:hypothetical protein
MVMFEERLYLLGGKRSDSSFHADAWYRGERGTLLMFILMMAVACPFCRLSVHSRI